LINPIDFAVKALSSFLSSSGNISLSNKAVFLRVEEDEIAFQYLSCFRFQSSVVSGNGSRIIRNALRSILRTPCKTGACNEDYGYKSFYHKDQLAELPILPVRDTHKYNIPRTIALENNPLLNQAGTRHFNRFFHLYISLQMRKSPLFNEIVRNVPYFYI